MENSRKNNELLAPNSKFWEQHLRIPSEPVISTQNDVFFISEHFVVARVQLISSNPSSTMKEQFSDNSISIECSIYSHSARRRYLDSKCTTIAIDFRILVKFRWISGRLSCDKCSKQHFFAEEYASEGTLGINVNKHYWNKHCARACVYMCVLRSRKGTQQWKVERFTRTPFMIALLEPSVFTHISFLSSIYIYVWLDSCESQCYSIISVG